MLLQDPANGLGALKRKLFVQRVWSGWISISFKIEVFVFSFFINHREVFEALQIFCLMEGCAADLKGDLKNWFFICAALRDL